MKNDPIEAAIARLDEIDPQTPEGRDHFRKALAGKSNLVAAKAARLIGERQVPEFTADLAAAFDRFLAKGSTADKGCVALPAIARSLVGFDYDDAGLFRRGVKHVQMEGTWGGNEDRAAELRSICAMGLANTRDPNKLRDLAELLADPEWPARAGAARALAATGADGAALLLRYKARIGDSEPEVFSDSLSGLIEIDGAAAMPLAGALAELHDPAVRDAAVLALGASRRADAVELLKEKFGRTVDREAKRCILLALATARTEPALAFLKELIDEGNAAAKEAAAAVGLQSLS